MLIYVDTNIYMDHFDGRVDKLKPLGEFAFQLFKKVIVIEGEFKIVVSPVVLEELFYNSYEEEIKQLLSDFESKGKIIHVEVSQQDIQKARFICNKRKTSFNDTLHAVLANKSKAEYLVTRNIKDFIELQDLIKVTLPENL